MDDSSKNFRIHYHANGSATLIDAENGQAMHSRIGPALEACVVYAARAKIEEFLDGYSREHVLYDIGMGTGANAVAALLRIAATYGARGALRIFSFESKPEGLRATLENLSIFPELIPWKTQLWSVLEKSACDFRVGHVTVEWRLLTGDFYARMADTPAPDTLFFDFYSPKVVPELWSFECFTRVREKIGNRPARLFTYSAATPVRLHLLAAGFFVGQGAMTGVKTETTIAATRLELLEIPLAPLWLRKLTASASISGSQFDAAKSRVLNHPQWKSLTPSG